MCFSATASFVAGASLAAIGVATLASAKQRSEVLFAAIPLLFGMQQLVEGVVWLTFRHEAPLLEQTMTYVYSGFSHVLWPVYIPLALLFLETAPWRRKTMAGFLAVGTVVGLYLLYFLVTRPVVADVVGRHITYDSPHFYIAPVIVLYVAATCFSEFFSSHSFVKLFGAFAFLSFVATYLYAVQALVSVWCFFAAVLSVLIYAHLRFRRFGGFPAPNGTGRVIRATVPLG